MENKKRPSWLKSKSEFRKVSSVVGGITLSKDTKDWPEEIIDHIHAKFPFLQKYSIVLNVDKKDKDKSSAMMFGVIVLGESRKISIVIAVSNGILLPMFVFVYKGKYYPLIEETVDDIENEDLELGMLNDEEEDFTSKKSPWSSMLDFLQGSNFGKRASIINDFERSENMDALSTLMTNEKIASLMGALAQERTVRHVKTASHHNGLYKEIIDGRVTQVRNVMLDTHVSSNRVKTAEINESIASEENKTIHYTNEAPNREGVIIKGSKYIPLIVGKTYVIPVVGKTIKAVCVATPYDKPLFCGKDGKFFRLISDTDKFELSKDKIVIPDPKEINEDDIGKNVYVKVGSDNNMKDKGRLDSLIFDGDEIIYVFASQKIIYSTGFKDGYMDGNIYVGKKLKGYVGNVESLIHTAPSEKVANDDGTYFRLEKLDEESDRISGKYQLDVSNTVTTGGSMVFPEQESAIVNSMSRDQETDESITGDRIEVEHRLVQERLVDSSVKKLIGEADKEGSGVMFVKEEKLVKDNPSGEAIKVASAIRATVKKYLSFDKIAGFINNDNISDVFSLHFLSKENVGQFMEEVPRIESVIDHLSRYYVLRTVGMSSETDLVDTKSLERLITGLYRVLKDLKKYKSVSG